MMNTLGAAAFTYVCASVSYCSGVNCWKGDIKLKGAKTRKFAITANFGPLKRQKRQ